MRCARKTIVHCLLVKTGKSGSQVTVTLKPDFPVFTESLCMIVIMLSPYGTVLYSMGICRVW